MAVNRTVLPNTGLVQPQHGLTQYEADQDANWALLDSLLASTNANQLVADLGLNGVTSGFTLSTSATLVPGLTVGVLYAQGKRYAPAAAPTLAAAPASATNYLFYNSSTGFYYQASAVGATAGDALIGQVVTSSSAVTAVTQGTKIFGAMSLAPAVVGNFTVQHFLGRQPVGMALRMTSGGAIWFQSPTDVDATNLYLVASAAAGVTGKVMLW
jgi:hypothetical protein